MEDQLIEKADQSNFDIQRFLLLILRFWWIVLIGLTIGLSVAYLINRYTTPIYRISAKLLLDDARKQRTIQKIILVLVFSP